MNHAFYSRTITLVILLALLSNSCKKDEVAPEEMSTPAMSSQYQSGELIYTSVSGFIHDVDGLALEAVQVSSGTSSTLTGSNGEFNLSSVQTDSYRLYVTAQSPGYHSTGRVLLPSDDGSSIVDISMIPLTVNGSFQAESGGIVSLNNGTSVSLDANTIVTQAGTNYTGQVDVSMYYLDPTSESIFSEMPGDLTALDSEGEFRLLESLGMAAFTLLTPGGEELQLAQGAQAQITIKVPEDLLFKASPTIPMWHFDEEEGVWREEGQATLDEDIYIAMVDHFSFFNADIDGNSVRLTGGLEDLDGNSLIGRVVKVKLLDGSSATGQVTTDFSGFFTGRVPANKAMLLVVDDRCDPNAEPIYSQVIGPFSSDHYAGLITVPESAVGDIQISGQLDLCEGAELPNFIAAVYYSDSNFELNACDIDSEGNFSTYLHCDDGLVYVMATWEEHGTPEYISLVSDKIELAAGQESLDFGLLGFCPSDPDVTEEAEYFHIELDGVNYDMLSSVDHEVSGQGNVVTGETTIGGELYEVEVNKSGDFTLGSYNTDQENTFELFVINSGTATPFSAYTVNSAESITFTFTEVASTIGEYTIASFTGTVFVSDLNSDQPNTYSNVPISGAFKVEREF